MAMQYLFSIGTSSALLNWLALVLGTIAAGGELSGVPSSCCELEGNGVLQMTHVDVARRIVVTNKQ